MISAKKEVEGQYLDKLQDSLRKVYSMGCRVNGPGETSHADLGLWCGPNLVNLKRGDKTIGAYSYEEITLRFLEELNKLITNQ